MATGAVAAATTMPVSTLPSSHARGKSMVISSFSSSLLQTNPEFSRSHLHVVNPLLGAGPFSSWSGLKHLGVYLRKSESKGRCRGRMVYASLFGVGAPEALVIGVVALLVFGPKGLAEIARNLGKTLRAFQPTIRELQDVSREFKSTLEREIGLDEVQSSLKSTISPDSSVTNKPQTPVDSNGAQSIKEPYTSEELLKQKQEQMPSSATSSQAQGTATEYTTSDAPPSDATTASVTSDEAATANSPAGSAATTPAASEAPLVTTNQKQEATSDPTVVITDKDEDLKSDATNA